MDVVDAFLVVGRQAHQEDIPFYRQQTRVVLEHCGHINAGSLKEYVAVGGYKALEKCLFEMSPEDILEEVSHLRQVLRA